MRTDFDIVIQAAQRFVANEPIYRISDLWEHTKPPLLMGLAFPLAVIPRFWIQLFWDLVIFLMPPLIVWVGLGLFPRDECWRWSWRSAVLTWTLLYPFWYREAELGQYNLFVFFLVLFAAACLQRSSAGWNFLAGALAALSVIVKPSQLYLLPWLWFGVLGLLQLTDDRSRLLRAGAGALALIYTVNHSFHSLIADHREYLEFLKLSSSKPLMRGDDFGIPTLLARMGFG